MLYIEEGKVLGYQRMLPSTRPHLLSDVMPELCEVERPVGPHVWEWTRYCVVQGHRDRGRALSPIGNALLSGIVEWGLYSGISTIIIEMTPIWLLRLHPERGPPPVSKLIMKSCTRGKIRTANRPQAAFAI